VPIVSGRFSFPIKRRRKLFRWAAKRQQNATESTCAVSQKTSGYIFMNNLVQNWPILTIFDANYLRINSTWVFTTELIFLAAVASGAAGRTLHPVLYFVSVCYEQTDRDNHPCRTLSASNSTRSHIHWSIWIMMLKNDFFWIFRGEVATSDVRFCEIFVSVFLGI